VSVISPKAMWTTGARRAAVPAAAVIARASITPNKLTAAGLLLNVAATPLIISGHFIWALFVYILASICDLLDGAVARITGQETAFGAFLDSTADRVAEGITLAAVAIYYARGGQFWTVGAVFIVMLSSFLVSYTRARAEALGLDCKVGLMSRPERIVVLGAGFAFSHWHALTVVIWGLAVLTTGTVVQRILHVRRGLLDAAAAASGQDVPGAGRADSGAGPTRPVTERGRSRRGPSRHGPSQAL
jgi:CDP-diacylglycerol--glycerol-3-phosphate 3-phosphatidyltransferase